MTIDESILAPRNVASHEKTELMVEPEAVHGGIDLLELQRLGIDPTDIIDLSSNVLSVKHPQSVRNAMADALVEPYPDRYCLQLRQAIANYLRVDAAGVLVGNGCSELIHQVASQWVQRDDVALIVGPTFSEYRRAIVLSGGVVDEVVASEVDNFSVPIFEIESRLQRQCYGSVWICNPNNPTGQSIDAGVVTRWAADYPETCFVVDESYIECAAGTETLVHTALSNVIVLRSMTKAFAMAGLRLGYLVASRDRVVSLERRRVPWSVNAVAQAAGTAVLQECHWYRQAMLRHHQAKVALVDSLVALKLRPTPSDTHFFLLPVSDPSAFRQRLLEKGVLIRDAQSFGVSGHVRIAVGDRLANQRLLRALAEEDASKEDGVHDAARSVRTVATTASFRSDRKEAAAAESFREQLCELFQMRRDVRRFRTDALPSGSVRRWIEAACLAPSVGLSQPWRFVSVRSAHRREHVVREFQQQNELAAEQYERDTAAQYRQLKLAGLREAPEHIAVFVESDPAQGRGLGRMTMPESVAYSVVAAIQNFWLAARCEGVGVGWVSILRPESIGRILDVPAHWRLIAYLCVGYPLNDHVSVPELETSGWESRRCLEDHWFEK